MYGHLIDIQTTQNFISLLPLTEDKVPTNQKS